MNTEATPSVSGIPSIVLLVESDSDTLDMYSTFFEMSGVWVAKSATPEDALTGVADLRPDAVVADVGPFTAAEVDDFVHTLKSRDDTHDIPVILLSGVPVLVGPARENDADLCLTKPVLPDTLLERVRALVRTSRSLRERSGTAHAKVAELATRSARLLERSRAITGRLEPEEDSAPAHSCPACGHQLEWTERGHVAGLEYDYFRWCTQGCGLYCYDRSAEKWVKLA